MKSGDVIKRVSEGDVNKNIALGYKFCAKAEWKDNVRGAVKATTNGASSNKNQAA